MFRRFALAFTLAAAPAGAQDVTALAEDYVNLPANQQMIGEMFSPASMAAQFESGLPPGMVLTDAQRAEVGELLSSVLTELRPQMETAMVDASATHFNAEELNALIAFYSSDVGASVLLKMQPYFTDYMSDIQPAMMMRIQSVLPEISRIMEGN